MDEHGTLAAVDADITAFKQRGDDCPPEDRHSVRLSLFDAFHATAERLFPPMPGYEHHDRIDIPLPEDYVYAERVGGGDDYTFTHALRNVRDERERAKGTDFGTHLRNAFFEIAPRNPFDDTESPSRAEVAQAVRRYEEHVKALRDTVEFAADWGDEDPRVLDNMRKAIVCLEAAKAVVDSPTLITSEEALKTAQQERVREYG